MGKIKPAGPIPQGGRLFIIPPTRDPQCDISIHLSTAREHLPPPPLPVSTVGSATLPATLTVLGHKMHFSFSRLIPHLRRGYLPTIPPGNFVCLLVSLFYQLSSCNKWFLSRYILKKKRVTLNHIYGVIEYRSLYSSHGYFQPNLCGGYL